MNDMIENGLTGRAIFGEGRPREDRPVYRTKPLPTGALRGRFIVSGPVLEATREALVEFALAGIHDGGHEGIVLWAGRELKDTTLFLSVIVPKANHSEEHVGVVPEEMARASRAARERGLGIQCQVHSHPGSDARHSDGDDDLVFMPFEGMLSVVVPHFGRGLTEIEDASVHQYQDGQWVLCNSDSVREQFLVAPTSVDLR